MKHLSTRRRRYSVSSGERKRRRLNQMRVIGGGRCVFGVVGPCRILLPGDRITCCWDGFCFDTAFAALVSLLLSCAKLTQGDVLLFFFTKKKKRSKKRKDLAYPCSERQCMPRLAVCVTPPSSLWTSPTSFHTLLP